MVEDPGGGGRLSDLAEIKVNVDLKLRVEADHVLVVAASGDTVWEGNMEEYGKLLYALQNAKRFSLPKYEVLLYRKPE